MRRSILAGATSVLMLMGGATIAIAAEGPSHGSEHAPPPPHASGPAQSGTVHANTDLKLHPIIHTPPKDIPHEGGVSIFGGTEHRPDGWRYRNENGLWWYWGPKNHWMYYENGGWQTYAAEGAPAEAAPVASDPNFYWYNNHWWYLRGESWLMYDHDRWNDHPSGEHPPRREMGHGPVILPQKHESEHEHESEHDSGHDSGHDTGHK